MNSVRMLCKEECILKNGFVENNIHFRIVSSKMLERYKNTQSFVLTEMIYGQYKFSKTAREIMMLSMDKWFNWLVWLERTLIKDDKNVFTREIFEATIIQKRQVDDAIVKTTIDRPDVFSQYETEVWVQSRLSTIKSWEDIIRTIIGEDSKSAFSIISSFVTEAIESLKFSLYEIDYLVNVGKNPFLCITNTCMHAKLDYGVNILEYKLEAYTALFPDVKEYILKNYSDAKQTNVCSSGLAEKYGVVFTSEDVIGIK